MKNELGPANRDLALFSWDLGKNRLFFSYDSSSQVSRGEKLINYAGLALFAGLIWTPLKIKNFTAKPYTNKHSKCNLRFSDFNFPVFSIEILWFFFDTKNSHGNVVFNEKKQS